MQFDAMKYLLCRAVSESADPDEPSADRVALATSLMGFDLAQSAVLAAVLAKSSAPPPKRGTAGTWPNRRRGRPAGASGPQAKARSVKVPSVRHLSDPDEIRTHLHGHKLRTVIHREVIPELKVPRVARQWPDADAEIEEGAEINVLLLVPEDANRGLEPRVTAARK